MSNSATRRVKKRALFDSVKSRGYAPCSYCGKKLTFAQATLDHVFPQSLGGNFSLRNLVLACEKCNSTKSSYDWRHKIKVSPSNPESLVALIESLSQPQNESTF